MTKQLIKTIVIIDERWGYIFPIYRSILLRYDNALFLINIQ